MSKLGKIFNEVDKLVRNNYKFFTTPGHKNGEAYKDLNFSFHHDITEVKGSDNLHNPLSCIKHSLDKLKNFYESKKSYYLVNGSTSGIQIMIFSSFNEGDEILIERGCHKSIINGIFLRKLKVNYIDREIYNLDFLNSKDDLKINYNKEDLFFNVIKEKIEKNKNIKGVILTNPNYYGIYIDQEKIYNYLNKRNILLLIDSAHGAHIRGFNKRLRCTNKYCDLNVMSAHKTLGALTQGGYLHVNNEKLIDKADLYFSIFTTTSPSYLIMESLEKALEDCTKYDQEILIKRCDEFRDFISENTNLYGLNNFYIKERSNNNFSFDDTRICLKFKNHNSNGNFLYEYLFSKKIICEMSFFNGVILIPTIYTKEEDFIFLEKCIKEFKLNEEMYDVDEIIFKACSLNYEKVLEPYEIENFNYEILLVKECEGRVLFNDIFLYPPGTPIIFRGERILRESLKLIYKYQEMGFEVNGLIDDKYLKVIEEKI